MPLARGSAATAAAADISKTQKPNTSACMCRQHPKEERIRLIVHKWPGSALEEWLRRQSPAPVERECHTRAPAGAGRRRCATPIKISPARAQPRLALTLILGLRYGLLYK